MLAGRRRSARSPSRSPESRRPHAESQPTPAWADGPARGPTVRAQSQSTPRWPSGRRHCVSGPRSGPNSASRDRNKTNETNDLPAAPGPRPSQRGVAAGGGRKEDGVTGQLLALSPVRRRGHPSRLTLDPPPAQGTHAIEPVRKRQPERGKFSDGLQVQIPRKVADGSVGALRMKWQHAQWTLESVLQPQS
eukprot:9489258-Pyramimonas_sp.AAC.4